MKHKPRKGKGTRKARAGQRAKETDNTYQSFPHSFVFNRGYVGRNINNLIMDMRLVMEPYTASSLKVRKGNVLKDFVAVASSLNVTHLVTFSKTELSAYMKVIRLPRGPTLTFKVNSYALVRDVISSIKRHHMDPKQFHHHPLLVMNKFSGEGMHMKLMSTTFQNMFPPLDIDKIKLNDVRRCVLLNYDADSKTIQFRHYNIRVVPIGLSRSVKKLVGAKLPNMSRFDDIAEFINRDGNASESEAEMDGPHNEVTLPQDVSSRGNIKSGKSAIRLTEIGPRMNLQLIKIEDGLMEGEVLYHDFVSKTEEELAVLHKMRAKKTKIKMLRKQQQEENVKRKAQQKKRVTFDDTSQNDAAVSDDDAEYYRQEVGEEPDEDLSLTSNKRKFGRKRPFGESGSNSIRGKRRKFSDGEGQQRGGKFSHNFKRSRGDAKNFGNRPPRRMGFDGEGRKMNRGGGSGRGRRGRR